MKNNERNEQITQALLDSFKPDTEVFLYLLQPGVEKKNLGKQELVSDLSRIKKGEGIYFKDSKISPTPAIQRITTKDDCIYIMLDENHVLKLALLPEKTEVKQIKGEAVKNLVTNTSLKTKILTKIAELEQQETGPKHELDFGGAFRGLASAMKIADLKLLSEGKWIFFNNTTHQSLLKQFPELKNTKHEMGIQKAGKFTHKLIRYLL